MRTRTLLFASFLLVTVLGFAAGTPPVPDAYSALYGQVTLLSFYWSSFFYGNLDYSSELDRIPYQDLTRRLNPKAFAAIRAQTPNGLGEFFQTLAQRRKD